MSLTEYIIFLILKEDNILCMEKHKDETFVQQKYFAIYEKQNGLSFNPKKKLF